MGSIFQIYLAYNQSDYHTNLSGRRLYLQLICRFCLNFFIHREAVRIWTLMDRYSQLQNRYAQSEGGKRSFEPSLGPCHEGVRGFDSHPRTNTFMIAISEYTFFPVIYSRSYKKFSITIATTVTLDIWVTCDKAHWTNTKRSCTIAGPINIRVEISYDWPLPWAKGSVKHTVHPFLSQTRSRSFRHEPLWSSWW